MSMNKDLTTNSTLPIIYDIGYVRLVNRVLKETADSFEKEQKFSESVLQNLYNIFGCVLERALELYERKCIVYIFPSETAGIASNSNRNNAKYLVQVKGHSGTIYVLFPEINYCTCASFRTQVLSDRSLFTCKHVLAVWLTTVTKDKVSYQHITEKEFQNLLLYQTTHKHVPGARNV